MDERNAYRDLIKENVEYDCLCEQYGKERMDEIVELLTDTVCSKREYITIASDDYPAEVVKSRLLKVHQFHVEYVLDCMKKNTTKVRNIKKYLLYANRILTAEYTKRRARITTRLFVCHA